MRKRKIVLILLTIAVIAIFVILFLAREKLMKPTSITISNKEIKLGMKLEEAQNILGSRYMLFQYDDYRGNVCRDVWVKYLLVDPDYIDGCDDFFDSRGRAYFYFNKKKRLQEILIRADKYYADIIFSKLKEEYGDNYIYDWLNEESYDNVVKGYRWDMENGTSILWLPETADSEFKELIITYSDDITEVVPPLVEE